MNEPAVTVFDPAPRLSIQVRNSLDAVKEIHIHAGGQAIWIARMTRLLGCEPVLCGPFGHESGMVLRALLVGEGIHVEPIDATSANGTSIHVGDEGDPDSNITRTLSPSLDRHEQDTLYSTVLGSALDTGTCVLAGVDQDDVIPADTFRRLTADLRANGVTVVADLSGEQLDAVAAGGIDLVKTSAEDLVGHPNSDLDTVRDAVDRLRALGAHDLVVSRASAGAYAWIGDDQYEMRPPELEVVNPRGAGDAMTGALAAMVAQRRNRVDAVRVAVAAGALNVTRHGLATGLRDAIDQLAARVVEVGMRGRSAAR